MAGIYNFKMKKGVPFTKTVTWTDSAGTAVDTTGKTAILTAKVRRSDETPVMTLASGAGITLGGTNGQITLSRSVVQLSSLDFKYASYDLFIGDTHLLSGEITLERTTNG